MCITDTALRVYNAKQGHASPFKKIHLLSVNRGNMMQWVGQARERQILFLPIALKFSQAIRPKRKNQHTALNKLCILIAQARQRRAAVRSQEAAQKVQNNNFVFVRPRKRDCVAL